MPGKVRVGVIGTGWWVDFMYAPSLNSHPGAEVVAVAGRDPARTAEIAQKFGGARVFADHRAMIAAGGLDAVVISVIDDLHYPVAMAALDAGLHVLCEKPLANSAADAREMYEKAEAAGVKHMVMFSWRWQPHWLYLKRLLDEGFVGRCHYAGFDFFGDGALHRSYQWRFDGKRANGVVGDMASHMIDFARWQLGEVTGIGARLTQAIDRVPFGGDPGPSNDTALLQLTLDNGTLAQIHASHAVAYGEGIVRMRIEYNGDAGRLEAEHVFLGSGAGVTIRGFKRDQAEARDLPTPADLLGGTDPTDLMAPYLLHSAGPRHFIDAILEDTPVSPTFLDGVKAQEVVDAALRSNAEGRWISLA